MMIMITMTHEIKLKISLINARISQGSEPRLHSVESRLPFDRLTILFADANQ